MYFHGTSWLILFYHKNFTGVNKKILIDFIAMRWLPPSPLKKESSGKKQEVLSVVNSPWKYIVEEASWLVDSSTK